MAGHEQGRPEDVLMLRYENLEKGIRLRWRYFPLQEDTEAAYIYKDGRLIAKVPFPENSLVLDCDNGNTAFQLEVRTVDSKGVESSGKSITVQWDSVKCNSVTKAITDSKVSSAGLERIGIKEGEPAVFINSATGKEFLPNGSNFIRLSGNKSRFDHANFIPEIYDPDEIEYVFELMNRFGYNVVRIFIAGRSEIVAGIAGNLDSTVDLDEIYMENVVDFLQRAVNHGIYVIPTLIYIPINRFFLDIVDSTPHGLVTGINRLVLTEGGIKAKIEYVQRFLNYIKSKDASLLNAIFSVQIENEEFLSATDKPFSLGAGKVETADGKVYDMSCPDSRYECMHNNSVNYLNRVVAAVKEVEPDLLVSESVFSYKAVGADPNKNYGILPVPWENEDPRVPLSLKSMADSNIDYLDFHFYPMYVQREKWQDEFWQHLESSGFHLVQDILKKKPIFLGEYGVFDFVTEDPLEAGRLLSDLRDYSRSLGFRGWALWTFDCEEQDRLLHGSFNGHRINRILGGYR